MKESDRNVMALHEKPILVAVIGFVSRRPWRGVGLIGYKALQRAVRSVLPASNRTNPFLFTEYLH
jgi:hypothetical protein